MSKSLHTSSLTSPNMKPNRPGSRSRKSRYDTRRNRNQPPRNTPYNSQSRRRDYDVSTTAKKPANYLSCPKCTLTFVEFGHMRKHLQSNEECFEAYPFKCGNCNYICRRSHELKQHFEKNVACNHYRHQRDVLSGILPPMKKSKGISETTMKWGKTDNQTQGKSIASFGEDYGQIFESDIDEHDKKMKEAAQKVPGLDNLKTVEKNSIIRRTSYDIKSKSIDGSTYDVTLLISDTTESQRQKLASFQSTNLQTYNSIEEFYKNSKLVANINESKLGPSLLFHDNLHNKLHNKDNTINGKERAIEKQMELLHQYIDHANYEQLREDELDEDYNQQPLHESEAEQGNAMEEHEIEFLDDLSTNVNIIPGNNDIQPNQHQLNITNNPDHLNNVLEQNLQPSLDMRNTQEKMLQKHEQVRLSDVDIMCVDLFHMMRASNAPLILYDRIIAWIKNHSSTLLTNSSSINKNLPSRKGLLKKMNEKLNYNKLYCHPKVTQITLSSGRSTSVVTFSAKDLIMKVVTNRSLLKKEHVVLNVDNPFEVPADNCPLQEANSGSWHKNAVKNECREGTNDLLMPWTFFIDGLKVDKFGKLTVEAVIGSCLWYNKETRNKSAAWSVLGFVEDQKLFRDFHSYIRDDKAQDYHDMLSHIFSEFKTIRDNGGLRVNLELDGRKTYDVNLIPVIQFIIGDCKGNDLLCGRMSGHSLKMKGLCRDCNITPDEGDDICLNTPLKCEFHTKHTIEGKSQEELARMSFMNIRNAFSALCF